MTDDVIGHSIIYLRSGEELWGVRFLGNVDVLKAQKQLGLVHPLNIVSKLDDEVVHHWCVDYRLKRFYPDAQELTLDVAW